MRATTTGTRGRRCSPRTGSRRTTGASSPSGMRRFGTSPIIDFNARDDTASVDVHSGLTDPVRNSFAHDLDYPLLTTLSKGQWNDFVMHVHWTRSADGLIQIYHRLAGAADTASAGQHHAHPDLPVHERRLRHRHLLPAGDLPRELLHSADDAELHEQPGRQPPTVIYQDQFARARTFAEVAAMAFPDSPPVLPKG